MFENPRVAVTGLGVIAPGSIGKEEFWLNMSSGNVFTGELTAFDKSGIRCPVSGEIKDNTFFENEKHQIFNKYPQAKESRAQLLTIASAKMALEDSSLDLNSIGNKNAYIAVGTTMGTDDGYYGKEPLSILENPAKEVLDKYTANKITECLISYFDFKNANSRMYMNACAAGNYAISSGFDQIKKGTCDFALVGGVDALSYIAIMGFNRLLSVTPDKCKPFDKNRKGMVVSEGSAFLILENYDKAINRGANIYAELKGYGLGVDAYHITGPHPEGLGAINSIKRALENSGLEASSIDYISAHGTGTPANDSAECKAVKNVFATKIPPMSSIKSMIGHSLGAASAIEAVACCLMLENQQILPTANFEEVDEKCPIDCIPNKSRPAKLNNVISNALAFGGNNSTIVLSKPDKTYANSPLEHKKSVDNNDFYSGNKETARVLAVKSFNFDDIDKYYEENLSLIDARTADSQSKVVSAAINELMKVYKEQKGIAIKDLPKGKTAIVSGSNYASLIPCMNFLHTAKTKSPLAVSPMAFPNTVANAPASRVSIWFGLADKVIAVSDGPMISGLNALLIAFEEVNRDSLYAFACAIDGTSATVALVGRGLD